MPGFDRSRLKATTAEVIQTQEKQFGTKRFDNNYLSIEVGENVIRIFPYHPDGGGKSFAEAKSVSYLEVKKPKRGEDKKIIEGEFEVKRSPIFNSRVHAGIQLDVVEQYIEFAKATAIPNFTDDDETIKKIMNKINGNVATKDNGIKPIDTWVVYACKAEGKDADGNHIWGKVGLLEIKKSVKDAMTEQAALLENPDPFSDPDEGIAVIITRAKEAKKASDWYKVRLDQRVSKLTTTYVTSPLTDAQIEQWIDSKPLHELYVNSFTRKDFESQLEGLQNFEIKMAEAGFPINVFQYDDFLDIVEKINGLIPEDTKSEKKEDSGDEIDEIFKEEPGKVKEQKKEEAAKTVTKSVSPKTSAPKIEVKKEEQVKEQQKEEVEIKSTAKTSTARLDEIRQRLGKK